MQEQITASSEQVAGGRGGAANLEVAKLQVFDRTPSKVSGFVTAYKLYGKAKMREVPVEEQIQWVLSYVQGGAADLWKENMLEELEAGELEFETVEEFLAEIKKKFGGEEKESVKAAELKKLEQRGIMMEEFVQEFKRAVRGSGYKERPLVEEFKRGMNEVIRRKLIEAENQPSSIEQWYRRATALNRNWRESKQEEERLRGKKEQGGGAPRQELRQILLRPLVWQRRQIPSQQATTRPALMERVEQTNAVMVRGPGQEMGTPSRRDPYTMEIDKGRNCYVCRRFGHLVCHCRN